MAIFDNLFGTQPEYLSGLLGADEAEKLRKQAMTTGLVNSAIALIAQPRNQRFGSALPYIGRALMAGQQAGQGVYNTALQGLETQQKLAEFKRKQEQQQRLQTMLSGITDPNERLAAEFATEQWAANRYKQAPAKAKLLTKEEQVAQGLPETGRYQVKSDGSIELVPGTAPKESALPSAVQEYQFAVSQGYKGTFDQWKNQQKPAPTTVQVSVGGETFAKEFGKGTAANVQNAFNEAVAAQDTLTKIQELRPVIQQGVYSGPLSKAERTVAQIATKLGTTGTNTQETLQRTAQAMQGLAQFELNAAAAMRGQGAITENERALIQRAAAGRLEELTAPEVSALLNALEKTNKFKVNKYEKTFKQLEKNPNAQEFIDFYRLPERQQPAQTVTRKKFNPATGRIE